MFEVHPFHRLSVIVFLFYVLALVCFYKRAKKVAKRAALHSRKRMEYSAIFFITSSCILAYLIKDASQGISSPGQETSNIVLAILSDVIPEIMSPSNLRTLFKVGATYGVFSLAVRARSRVRHQGL